VPDGRTDFDDALVFDEDFAGRDYFSGCNVEEARGVEYDRVLRGGRRRLAEDGREENASQENDQERYGKGGF
jgi:hypothetical protein